MLFKGLPEALNVGDMDYPINTDFRVMLLYDELMQDESIPLNMRFLYGLENLYKKVPKDIIVAIEKMQWYERLGDTLPSPEEDNKGPKEPIFSFKYDYPYLYAAFKAQYNIDLFEDGLHWWKFMYLFNSLDENHKLSKIMGYRAIDLRYIKDKDRRKFIMDQKKMYALPESQYIDKQMSSNDIANAFL